MGYAMPAALRPPDATATLPLPAAPAPEESAAIRQVLAGDGNAFNHLVSTYQGLAYRVAYRLLHNEEAAADATQEAFLKAYRSLATYRGGQFKYWLLRIVVNTCYDLLRTQRRRPELAIDELPDPLADPAARPDVYVERQELVRWLEQGLCSLPAEQRAAVILHDVQGYSYEEVAAILGVPLGTVKSRLNRSRTRLRDFLLAHGVAF